MRGGSAAFSAAADRQPFLRGGRPLLHRAGQHPPRTQAEEQARLGHELGHCLYGGFYTRATPFDLAERHEARADRWYILRAIPRSRLFELLRQGYDAWEIAEYLNTTEDYVRRAYYFYKENP